MMITKKDRDLMVEIELLDFDKKAKDKKWLRAMAIVGLNAVVDEVTGFQKERMKKKNSLHKMRDKLLKF